MNRYRFEDLSVGLEEHFSATIRADMLDVFHELSADPNPLHLDDDFARMHGFPNRVVYGMLTASLFSTLGGGLSARRAVSDPKR